MEIGEMTQEQKNKALCIASMDGTLSDVRALLRVGADVHAYDDRALRWAAEYGHADVVRELQVAMEATRG